MWCFLFFLSSKVTFWQEILIPPFSPTSITKVFLCHQLDRPPIWWIFNCHQYVWFSIHLSSISWTHPPILYTSSWCGTPSFLPKSYSIGNSSILSYITKACHHSSDGSSIATNCNTQLFGFPSFNLQSRQSHHHLIYSSIQCSFKSFFTQTSCQRSVTPPQSSSLNHQSVKTPTLCFSLQCSFKSLLNSNLFPQILHSRVILIVA